MPLTQSSSQDAWTSNLKAELGAGKPRAQALAIAYDVQRRNRADGGVAHPMLEDLERQHPLDQGLGYARRQEADPEALKQHIIDKYRLGPTGYRDAEEYASHLRTFENAATYEGDGRDDGGAIDRALRLAQMPQRAFGGGAGYEPRPGARGRSNSTYGFLAGAGGGRTDKNNVSVAPGSYVLPADVIGGLGAGNSESGAAVWNEYLKSMPWGVNPPQISGKRGPPQPPTGNPDTGRRQQERSTLPGQERQYQPALGTGLADGGDPDDAGAPPAPPPAPLNMFDPGMVNEPEMFGDPALFGHNDGPPVEEEQEDVPIQAADGEVILSPEDTLRFANFYAPDELRAKGDRESMLDYAHKLLDEFVVVQRGRNIAHQEKLQGPVGSKHENIGHVRPKE